MSEVPRWRVDVMEDEYGRPWPHHVPDTNGPCVAYDAHVAAVAAAEQRQREDDNRALWDDRQFNDGVKAAREAVAAHIRADLTGQEMFCGRKRGILAAIDALISGKIGESDE